MLYWLDPVVDKCNVWKLVRYLYETLQNANQHGHRKVNFARRRKEKIQTRRRRYGAAKYPAKISKLWSGDGVGGAKRQSLLVHITPESLVRCTRCRVYIGYNARKPDTGKWGNEMGQNLKPQNGECMAGLATNLAYSNGEPASHQLRVKAGGIVPQPLMVQSVFLHFWHPGRSLGLSRHSSVFCGDAENCARLKNIHLRIFIRSQRSPVGTMAPLVLIAVLLVANDVLFTKVRSDHYM